MSDTKTTWGVRNGQGRLVGQLQVEIVAHGDGDPTVRWAIVDEHGHILDRNIEIAMSLPRHGEASADQAALMIASNLIRKAPPSMATHNPNKPKQKKLLDEWLELHQKELEAARRAKLFEMLARLLARDKWLEEQELEQKLIHHTR
jgi:hypothetical protein